MYKVSVIVPVYGAEKYIGRCAVSLFEQSLDSIEYIFIDDCTPDGSMNILRDILEDYPSRQKDTKILRMPHNSKQAAVRNLGLENCSGEYVIHCDPDDWVEKDIYEKMYNMARETGADITCVNLIYETCSGQEFATYNATLKSPEDVIRSERRKYWLPCHLVKRFIIENNHLRFFPNVNLWEDTGFLLRVYFYSTSIAYVQDYLYHYNKTNENSTTAGEPIANIRQEVNCTILLKQFFIDKNASTLYLDYVETIQFKILRKALVNGVELDEWRNFFPALSKSYLYNKNCKDPLMLRILLFLYSKGFTWPLGVLKKVL